MDKKEYIKNRKNSQFLVDSYFTIIDKDKSVHDINSIIPFVDVYKLRNKLDDYFKINFIHNKEGDLVKVY